LTETRVQESDASALTAALANVGDRWDRIKTLIRARLLVATLALPIGVLLAPRAAREAWSVLWWSLVAVGALSALYWVGAALRRGETAQYAVQFTLDLVLVTVLAALTGGRESQFVVFFALIAIAGGLHLRLSGGVATAVAAALGYVALPWIAPMFGAPAGAEARPDLFGTFFVMVGVLSGILGRRIQRTRGHLERTARELSRVMVNNDLILRTSPRGHHGGSHRHGAYLNPAAEEILGVVFRDCAGAGPGLAARAAARVARHPDVQPRAGTVAESRRDRVRNGGGVSLVLGISTSLLMHDDAVTGVVAVFQDLTRCAIWSARCAVTRRWPKSARWWPASPTSCATGSIRSAVRWSACSANSSSTARTQC
jgi:PAS domain-containing protein